MKAYYKVTITKERDGTAIIHNEPPLQGDVIVKISDMTTAGDQKLVAVEVNKEQHTANLAMSGVAAIEENEAVKLAPKFQPKHKVKEFNRHTGAEETREIKAFDIIKYIKAREDSLKGSVKEPAPKKKARRKAKPPTK